MNIRAIVFVLTVLAGIVAVSSASGSTLYWDQTQSFSLTETPNDLVRYEGDGQVQALSESFQQVDLLSFQGAPATFSLAGKNYRLTGAQLSFDSTFFYDNKIYGVDHDWFSDVHVDGEIQSLLWVSDVWSFLELDSHSNEWAESCAFYGSLFAGSGCGRRWSKQETFAFTREWLAGDASGDALLNYISSHETYGFEIGKGAYLSLLNWFADDSMSVVEMSESNWSGSMAMRYTYESVPLPSAAWLMASGLVGIGILGRQASSSSVVR